MSFKFKMTVPKPNLKWYSSSKKDILQAVKKHHERAWSAERDPVTGNKWQPRKQPTGSHPLLRKSGKMLGSTKFKAGSNAFDLSARTNVKYGGFHQRGTSKMPQRRWLGLGSEFSRAFANMVGGKIFKGKYTFKAGYGTR